MPYLTEAAAGRYALAVYNVLVADWPRLADKTLKLIVLENVGRQAELGSASFQLIVDEPQVASWRLVPDLSSDRWRVQLACCKPRPSHANSEREQRINAALRAIELEA